MRYLLLLLAFTYVLFASPVDLSKAKWEYKIGDSPRDNNGSFFWIEDKGSVWKTIAFPSNPDERNGNNNLWFRVKLPDAHFRDPTLFIFSIDLVAQVYLDRKEIYAFGEFDKNGRGSFSGWPWHMIELPLDFQGKYLYFRVWSDAGDIGLWGEIALDEKINHVSRILHTDIARFSIGSVALFMGAVLLIFFLMHLKHREYGYLSLLFLTQGADLMASTEIKQLLWFEPLFFQYLLAFSYFFFPVGVALFVSELVDKKGRNILKFVWIPHLLFLLSALFLSVSGLVDLPLTYSRFDFLYYFFSLPLLIIYLGINALKNGIEAILLFSAYVILVLFYLYSTLVAFGFLDWTPYPTYAGVFVFLSILVFILGRRYSMTHKRLGAEIKKGEEQEKIILEQSKMVFLGEMLSAITHQWVQPLSTISMMVDNIEEFKETNPGSMKQTLHSMRKQIKYMSDTMKSFKDFAKPTSRREEFSLHSVFEQTAVILEARLKKSGIAVLIPQKDIELEGKKEDLLQVLMVLFHNAIDAINAHGMESGTIKVDFETTENVVIITVSDNGGGIKETVLDKLFKKKITTKGDQGTGIGLGIAKLIVEKGFKGTINCRNIEAGALFEITLPLE